MTDAQILASIKKINTFCEDVQMGLHPSRVLGLVDEIQMLLEIVQQMIERKMIPSQPDKLMEHMTEPELAAHLSRQLNFIKRCQSEDTVGSMLVIFQKDRITQYGATLDPETVPAALHELADRIEKRQTIKRGGEVLLEENFNRERRDNENEGRRFR